MAITVYGSKISPYTLRVLVTLHELDVRDYKWAPVNMAPLVKEHHSLEFKSNLQPFGQVPVMHDDDLDLTLFDTSAYFNVIDVIVPSKTALHFKGAQAPDTQARYLVKWTRLQHCEAPCACPGNSQLDSTAQRR